MVDMTCPWCGIPACWEEGGCDGLKQARAEVVAEVGVNAEAPRASLTLEPAQLTQYYNALNERFLRQAAQQTGG